MAAELPAFIAARTCIGWNDASSNALIAEGFYSITQLGMVDNACFPS